MNILLITEIIQIIASILIIFLVLIQSKGTGLYSGVGSNIGFYRSRRGIEKAVFILTIVLIVILVLNSAAIILLS